MRLMSWPGQVSSSYNRVKHLCLSVRCSLYSFGDSFNSTDCSISCPDIFPTYNPLPGLMLYNALVSKSQHDKLRYRG